MVTLWIEMFFSLRVGVDGEAEALSFEVNGKRSNVWSG